jgi:hypothetical protein
LKEVQICCGGGRPEIPSVSAAFCVSAPFAILTIFFPGNDIAMSKDLSNLTDGQILIELKRTLAFCDQMTKELSRRAIEDPETLEA